MSKIEQKNQSEVIELAIELMSRASVTPEDAGCQKLMSQRLAKLGFTNESMVFADTTNLWSRRDSTNEIKVDDLVFVLLVTPMLYQQATLNYGTHHRLNRL